MPKERIMLDLFVRPAPRAPLQRVICWNSQQPRARIWTLVAQIRTLLTALEPKGYSATDVTMEEELSHAKPEEAWNGNPRPDFKPTLR